MEATRLPMTVSTPIKDTLSAKQRLALTAFESGKEVRVYQLPTYVGRGTMAQLVRLLRSEV